MPKRRQLANAIRILSVDAVQQANSGHPGMPMGMADIAQVLWNDFLVHNPANPEWVNRDRFILSNGHGSMLLYALLHLTGYDLPMAEIKNFRQLHSKTPGHPEYRETVGVETTTGPLGQGFANAVGMALAEKHLAARFNRAEFPLVDHFTYAFVGDGDLMEGVSHEVASLAGTLGLGKLIVFYDDNQISIDGNVTGWFTDNTPLRFESYGWHVIKDIDGHDSEAIRQAIMAAKSETNRPSILCCKTIIGFGAGALAGSAETHGAALGEAGVQAARLNLEWPYPPFVIPEEYYAAWNAESKGQEAELAWKNLFAAYQTAYPALAAEFSRRKNACLPDSWSHANEAFIKTRQAKKESIATRKASQLCIEHLTQLLPELMGGSADLTGSNLTNWQAMQVFSKTNPAGQYLHYGVREFGMSAIMNGLALYGGILPFGGTFLTFSDYARNALRLAALMRTRVIFIYSHDSIGLGEDGPTHQPIEHIPSLRIMPGLSLWRPADAVETAVAWQKAIEHDGPTCLILSRQALPFNERSDATVADIARGGYVLSDCQGTPTVIIIATGSEVALAEASAIELKSQGILVRVVSMPSTDVFLAQSAEYQEKVLPKKVTFRIAIEAAASAGWHQWVGSHGVVLGIDRYGASAPANEVFKEYGFTVPHIVAIVKAKLNMSNHCITETVL